MADFIDDINLGFFYIHGEHISLPLFNEKVVFALQSSRLSNWCSDADPVYANEWCADYLFYFTGSAEVSKPAAAAPTKKWVTLVRHSFS